MTYDCHDLVTKTHMRVCVTINEDVKLEGREDPVTLVEALLHKSESEQDKSTVAILWAINCGGVCHCDVYDRVY